MRRVVECCDGKKTGLFFWVHQKDLSRRFFITGRSIPHCPNNHPTIMPYRQKKPYYSEMHVKKQYFETSIASLTHFQQLLSRAGTDPITPTSYSNGEEQEKFTISQYSDSHFTKFQLKLFFILSPYFCCLGQESGGMQGLMAQRCFPISKPPRF